MHTDILTGTTKTTARTCCEVCFIPCIVFALPLGFEWCEETHPLTRKQIDLNAGGGARERDAVRMQSSEKEERNGRLLAIRS